MKKYALVTGADHGVGFSLVENLIKRGYTVIACQFDEKEEALSNLRCSNPDRLYIVSLDISSDESVSGMNEKVTKLVPHIDLLINNAGGQVIVMHPGHVATYMRGHLDTTAKITADVSAEGILKTVLDTKLPVEERPLYLDYQGKRLPW